MSCTTPITEAAEIAEGDRYVEMFGGIVGFHAAGKWAQLFAECLAEAAREFGPREDWLSDDQIVACATALLRDRQGEVFDFLRGIQALAEVTAGFGPTNTPTERNV